MTTLEILGIAGFRSYPVNSMQKIEFKKPITLIWGKNGSGKTTIIEVLKYITTGALPPSGEKGKSFITEPRMIGRNQVTAEAKLKFRAFNGRPVLATRRSQLLINNKGSKFESLEQILKTKDQNGDPIEINHQCAQIEKQIPMLLGSSKAILEKIIFCHQDESLWPFQDSVVLKNIFDQLFDTKTYTRVIEEVWEQKKQYQRQINQLKKSLGYLEKMYTTDKKNKVNRLRQMEQIVEETYEVRKMKDQVQKVENQLQQVNDQTLNQKRYNFGIEKNNIENKLESLNQVLNSIKQRQNQIKNEYVKISEDSITITFDQATHNITFLRQKLINLKNKSEQLTEQINAMKCDQVLTKKQLQINTQINLAKRYLSGMNSLSENQICKKSIQRVRQLTRKKQQLSALQGQYQKIQPSNTYIGLLLTEQEFRSQQKQIEKMRNVFQELKKSIISYYKTMHKPIDQKSLKLAMSFKQQDHYSQELSVLQYQLSIKRKQLVDIQKLPRNNHEVKQQIMRLRFAGIQYYEGYLEFCKEKKKCLLCSKPLTAQELTTITKKIEKSKVKTEKQISEMQRQNPHLYDSEYQGLNPEAMVHRLKQEIDQGQKREKVLAQYVSKQQQILKIKTQISINRKLQQGIKSTQLEKQILNNQKTNIPENPTIDEFNNIVNKYIGMEQQLERKAYIVKKYVQTSKKNEQSKMKNQQLQQKRNKLQQKISLLQDETKQYDYISKTAQTLERLLKEKQNQPKTGNASKSRKTLAQLSNQAFDLEEDIKMAKLELQYSQNLLQINKIQQQVAIHHGAKDKLNFQLKQITQQIDLHRQKVAKFNEMKTIYVAKQHSMDLRRDNSFQQYFHSIQKQYLLQKTKMIQYQKNMKDAQIFYTSVQKSISQVHKHKMDEVNKVIYEIWKQIYHEDDIDSIEIQTQIETDTKKKKNYKYSIMMVKKGLGMTKVQMKGRCSMGQKVLASIVIRLALAEVFSTSARILALDEPTTFLDRQHINRLAKQLGKLIEINQYSSSLQLIIISHDQEFVRLMEKYTDHYYEVSRNENQFSIITKKDIRQMFI